MTKWLIVAAAGVIAGGVGVASAQDGARPLTDAELVGSPEAGAILAAAQCGACHAVEPGATASPVEASTPFQVLADTPGMTEMALTAWLTSFHPARTMPPIALERDDRQNIIAYILSLGE